MPDDPIFGLWPPEVIWFNDGLDLFPNCGPNKLSKAEESEVDFDDKLGWLPGTVDGLLDSPLPPYPKPLLPPYIDWLFIGVVPEPYPIPIVLPLFIPADVDDKPDVIPPLIPLFIIGGGVELKSVWVKSVGADFALVLLLPPLLDFGLVCSAWMGCCLFILSWNSCSFWIFCFSARLKLTFPLEWKRNQSINITKHDCYSHNDNLKAYSMMSNRGRNTIFCIFL